MKLTLSNFFFERKDSKTEVESDESFKLSFAFQNLVAYDDRLLPFENYRKETVLILDLTENNFTGLNDLKFLFDFSNLKTLILDKNQIQSNIRMPYMPNLSTLWVNHNKIENLSIFVENIAMSCPSLVYLSMMNNKAAPSYFNGGSLAEYNDYRFYTMSKLVNLKMLDDKEITPEERVQSKAIYGTGRLARHNDSSRKMSLQPNRLKKSSSVKDTTDKVKKRKDKRANSVIVEYSAKENDNSLEASRQSLMSSSLVLSIDENSVLEEVDLPSVENSNDSEANNLESEIATWDGDNSQSNDSNPGFDASASLMLAENLPDIVDEVRAYSPPSPALALLVDLDSLPDVDQK
jgi:hypothetical protein